MIVIIQNVHVRNGAKCVIFYGSAVIYYSKNGDRVVQCMCVLRVCTHTRVRCLRHSQKRHSQVSQYMHARTWNHTRKFVVFLFINIFRLLFVVRHQKKNFFPSPYMWAFFLFCHPVRAFVCVYICRQKNGPNVEKFNVAIFYAPLSFCCIFFAIFLANTRCLFFFPLPI